jgi:hypothetical protein
VGSAGARSAPTPAPPTPAAPAPDPPAAAPPAFPPTPVHLLGRNGADAVDPTGAYDSEPAPMGIGDFGVGAEGVPYTYNTTEFLGNFSWQRLNLNGESGTSFTDQLNVVLQFVQHGVTYAYWIQDVAFMDSADNALSFENNIWNFSSSQSCLSNSGVSGNGTVYAYSGCEGYYAVSPASSLPGASRTMPNPGDFGLLVRSYVTAGGLPAVAFEYWDGVTSWYVTYDNVVWPWASGFSADNGFVVDGSEYTPLGLFYDAELTIGGPGGGSSTVAQPTTDASSRLTYWNGHNFEAPPSVWNFGSNTAEAVSNVQSYFAHDAAGFPYTVQLNGTARNATPARAYDQTEVGSLSVTAASVASGTLAVGADDVPFVDDRAEVALAAGTYPVWVNSTGGDTALGLCTIDPGTTTVASTTSGCGPWVGTPTGAPASADIGQPVTFNVSVLNPGSGGDTFAWSTTPSGLGCGASTTDVLSCTPTASGAYAVSVTMTDSESRSSTSGTLDFTVDSDPSVGPPSAEPASVETGESVTFSVSPSGGNSAEYSYAWHGLPTPCTGTGSGSPTCRPGTAGGYSVSVTVTDGNGDSVLSASTAFTVSSGPAASDPVARPGTALDVGEAVNFSTSASGGTGGYTYSWSGLPTGCRSVSAPEISCVPSGAGTFSVAVTVTDLSGGTGSSGSLAVTVHPAVAIGSVRVGMPAIDVGQAWSASAEAVSGGSGVYGYRWSGLPLGCDSANASTIACTPTAPSAGPVFVVVTDSLGGNASASAGFSVNAAPTVAGVVPSRGSVDLGETVTFTATGVAGGTGPLTYAWTGLPAGCASENAPSVVCRPATAGVSAVEVSVVDSVGGSANASLAFPVYAAPAVSAPNASAPSGETGTTVTFSTQVSGGVGPYSYAWSGLPAGCSSTNRSTVTCAPSTAGTYPVTVTVTDANGATARSAALPFTVEARPGAAPGPTTEEDLLIALGVAAALVAIVVVAAVVRRKRSG